MANLLGGVPGFRRRTLGGNFFKSAEQTGTGAPQNIAHGLGVKPSRVQLVPSTADGNANSWAEGTHTSTNVVCTVTAGVKFYAYAWP